MNRLPIEITTQILSFLPLRYVFRSRIVCKTWRSIIDNSQFPALHFAKSIKSQTHMKRSRTNFLLLASDFHAVYIVEEDDSNNFKSTKVQIASPTQQLNSKLSVNGLFYFSTAGLVTNTEANEWENYICNPFTQQFLKLPKIHNPNFVFSRVGSGFGFDPLEMQFKAVLLHHDITNGDVYSELGKINAQVFTLGTKSWRKLENFPNAVCSPFTAFVNGSIHWYHERQIVSFDVGSEIVGFIELPESRRKNRSGTIMNIDGWLSVVDYSGGFIENIWVLKDYGKRKSWTRIMFSNKLCICDGVRIMSMVPISFWKEGEILLLLNLRKLVSYNVESGSYTSVEIDGLPQNDKFHFQVHPYGGNLLSLQPVE